MIHVSYKTKRGGHVLKQFADRSDAEDEIVRLYERRTPADAWTMEEDERVWVGEVLKIDGKWTWMFDRNY